MLWEKFKGRVLVPGPCALELAKTFRIPTQAIYPIFPEIPTILTILP